ncbi:MAG TPA: PVC-type heme-binding CxxCH protein [Candidatus Angelobacter sp.]|nr:PVC-type heme-binding CxxCH protein [Candidatus Angelobacter sp.]
MNPFALRAAAAAATLIGPLTFAAQFKFGDQTLTVPDGFEVELVSSTNLVQRPVSASFDDHGRLYVTDSSGSNAKPDEQLKNPSARIIRLEDTDGDGRFDKSVVFADKVMFPQGCLWHDGSVYVAGPPSIWKFTDTDGDGVADKREEWFKGGTLTGCANDIHGPYLGPDGYIYWTKGAFAEQTHKLGNGRVLNDRAAHIYRARPDGSDLDVIMSGGMDNPVEVAFTPEGEAIFTSTFIDFSQPGYRDGIAHAVYGGVFGKQNDVLEDGRVKRTGPELMHPFYEAGNAAECGLCRYESAVFGNDYRDNFFATTFNLHKVTRHILQPKGATYASTDSDFLVSDSVDFHPTDVLEDADGSLLVLDTGGWYKLCCPSSQLAKPDVLGAVYRVRKREGEKLEDPRGLRIAWARMKPSELAKFLDDARPAVVKHAIESLAKKADASLPALRRIVSSGKDTNGFKDKRAKNKGEWLNRYHHWREEQIAKLPYTTRARQNALWALTRIESSEARAAVRVGTDDFEEAVRLAAYDSISLHRDRAGGENVAKSLNEFMSPQEWRAAFETIGRTCTFSKLTAVGLLASFDSEAMKFGKDRVLQQSLCYALIEARAIEATRFLEGHAVEFGPSPLIALDQMDGSDLKASDVLPFLNASDEHLRSAANWIVGHHPDWGGTLASFFRERLANQHLADTDLETMQHQLAQLARSSAIQDLLGESCATGSKESRLAALRAISQTSLKEVPASWSTGLSHALADADDAILHAATAAVRALPAGKANAPDFSGSLLKIGRNSSRPVDLRLDALAAMRNGLKDVEPGLFEFLASNLGSAKPPEIRSTAASVVGRAELADDQLLALADALETAGPLEVSRLISAFAHTSAEAVGTKLVAALKGSKALNSLRADQLKPLLEKFPESVRKDGEALLLSLNADAAKQKAHLEELLASLPKGDIRRGQAIFNSPKTACSTCHSIGYLGGHVGPDLTKIGEVRTERDLLESIVYPSASFVRSYEPVIVVTKSNDEISGVLKKDAADEVVLATGPNTEVRVARADITEIRPGTVSVMPQGLDEQLNRQELGDLLAFLKGTKWGAQ